MNARTSVACCSCAVTGSIANSTPTGWHCDPTTSIRRPLTRSRLEYLQHHGLVVGILRSVAQIILVHGIAQEQCSADTLESTWFPALAGGIRTAGHPDLADRVWRDSRPGNAGMAFCADVFRRPDQQGETAGSGTAEQQALHDAILANAVIDRPVAAALSR